MRLRSRKQAAVTNGRWEMRTNRRKTSYKEGLEGQSQPDSFQETPDKSSSPPSSHSESDEDMVSPVMRRPPVVRGRGRKRRSVFRETTGVEEFKTPGFKTPVRVGSQRVLSEVDPSSPRNTTMRNIYSPIVRFLTPTKENPRTPSTGTRDVLMSPQQCVFGFGSVSLLEGEEENDDVFSPFSFIKNIPEQSEQPKPLVRDIPPKTRSTPEATLVLDLDETLMYSSLTLIEDAEYTFQTSFQDNDYKVYMILRPHVKEFLEAMSKVFEMFVYTSAKKQYAGKILDILDPKRKVFRHRLYQEDCVCVLGHYVKDLSVLERDLAKTVVLDNAPHTYPYNLMNMLPIKSWTGDKDDKELLKLIPYLEKLAATDDFRGVLKRRTDHFHRLLSED